MNPRTVRWLVALAGVVTVASCSPRAPSLPAPSSDDVVLVQSALNTSVVITVVDTVGTAQSGLLVYAQKKSTGAFVSSATTNAQGHATISLANGQYRFATAGSGVDFYFYSGIPGSCTTPTCTTATITITHPVVVTVVDTAGVAQVDAEVLAENGNGDFVASSFTDANGHAAISVNPGSYRFGTPGVGTGFFFYSGASGHCTVAGCTTATITVTHPVVVTVQDSQGNPQVDVEVLAEDPDGNYVNLDYTDSQGHVSLSVDVGSYRFVAALDDVLFTSGASGHCAVPGCTTATIVIPAPVVVTVIDGAGHAIASQTVLAQPDGCGSSVSEATDAQGHVTFTLPSGGWRFAASCGCETFYSGVAGHCVIPGCTTAQIVMICGGCTGHADGTACNDGDPCTQTDTCHSGGCVGSNPVTCTAQDQCHVAGTCNSSTGACSNPAKSNGTSCSDGSACTQTDTCQSGTCTGSNPVTCTASDQCHNAGTCDPANGTCSNPAKSNGTACNDGNACTQTDTCQSGSCSGGNSVTCTASDQCHNVGTCDPANGTCSNPAKSNGTACNDGNACTQMDTCQSGSCSGGNSVTCTASDQCHNVGTCDPANGTCSNPAKSNGTACNDGNACTQTDMCQSGSCSGGNSVTCTASDQCHNVGTCDTANGTCSNPAKSNGTACNDGNACTQTDTCQSGSCSGGNSVTCTASDQCHNPGTCDPANGTCSNPAKSNGTACNDGNACTQTDTCQSGSCSGGNPVTCTASDQCHNAGTCDPANGTCSNPAKTNGTACNDGNLCTTADACQTGACVGTPKPCLAADACHDQGTCNPANGACTNPPRACATNHPPKITSQPVVDFIRTTVTGPLLPVSLRAWTPVIYEFFDQPDASWTVDTSGTVATQSVNADASVLLSDMTLVNDHMEGTWQVSSPFDDDFMGFVFGWQDRTHFYLFDWKAFDQNDLTFGFAHRGMSVKVVSADTDLREPDLWPTDGNGARVRNIFHNDIGWDHFVSYKFMLDVHPGHFTITVKQGTTTLATIDLADDTYPSGRFGFYNDSQDNVVYSGFHKQTLPTRQYQYDVDATDPDSDTLVYSLLTAPSGMTIDASTGLIAWDTTGAAAGPHDVAVQVSDPSGLVDIQRFTIVIEDNEPPIVDAGPDQQALGVKFPGIVTLPGSVQDELPVGDSRLEIAWSVVSGPGPVVFTNTSSPTTDAIFFQPGTYVLQLSANDSLATTNDFVTVTVDSQPSLQGASFTLTASSAGPLQVGTTLTLTATLLDASAHAMSGFPVQFQISGANPQAVTSPTDANGVAHFSYAGTNPGTDNIQAVALGSVSTVTASIAPISWTPATGGPAVQVTQGWIGAPLHQATVKGSVPITVAAGVTITSGSVEYWPLNQPADVHTLAASVAGAPGATLATLDTTLLANGPYVVRLNATNSNSVQQASLVAVTVTGDYKPGRMTVAITDFTVPLVGLPITVGRSYDSLERSKVGDFGNGWSLTIGNPRLEVDPAHNVTLTEPSGRRVTFGFIPTSYGSFFSFLYAPAFTPEAGVFGSLTSDGCALLIPSGGRVYCFLEASPDFAPTTYAYKDAYGREFTMAATGQLRGIKDLNGNQIMIGTGGITSSAGGVNVPFVRDGAGRITQITDLSGNHRTYEYDAGGDLVATVTPGGRHTYTYDGAHLLLHAVDPNGHSPATATYDSQGRLATTTDAVGNTTQYGYNVVTRTTTSTNPDTGVVTQVFDDRGLLLSETDPLGHATTRTYDTQRLKLTETNAANETTHWAYDTSGREISRTDAAGRVTSTTYNALGQVTSGTDAANHTVSVAYDEKFAPTSFSDELGTIATFTSSAQGLPLAITDANGGTASLAYDARGNKISSVDRLGRITTLAYDDMGRLTLTTDARGGQTHTTYTGLGRIATRQDSLANTTNFTYDSVGNLLTQSRPGTTALQRYTYDPANRVTLIQNFDNTTRSFTYDFRGNKLTETDELERVTSHEYNHAGQLVKTTFPDGTFTTRTYDALGRLASLTDERTHTKSYQYETGCGCSERLTSTTDPLNRTTSTTYDAVGRRISMTDASGRLTQFAYDVRGHLLQTTYPDFSTTHDSYAVDGRRTAHTDQTGAVTRYGYDGEGQLTSVTDALGNITVYDYDPSGNLAGVSDANEHRTTYEYDLLSRKTKRTLPLRQAETFAYDPVGNLAAHVDFRGKTTIYTHDLRDHLLTKVPDPSLGEPTVTFMFNLSGTRASMSDASGSTNYTYDLRDRLLTKATPAGTLTYTYDPSGSVASIRSSNTNGTSVDYVWDAANELVSVTDNRASGITTAAYTATGRPSLTTQPSGVAASYTYDALDRVASTACRRGTAPAFASWAYTRNGRGQRLTATDVTGRQAAYGYDAAARLTSETVTGDPGGATGNGAISYVLDATGNRLSRTSTLAAIPSITNTFDAADELTTDGYDANGNTTTADGHTYAYDFENHLVSKNAGAVQVLYDGDGNRVAKTVGGVTTKYLVDDLNPTGYLQVLEEASDGTAQVRYSYGSMLVSQARAGSGMSFYGYDAHGNVTFLTDTTGAVTDTYEFDAFGNLVRSSGTTVNTRLYAGEELDPDLGLINLRARQYKPGTGRFLTSDPVSGKLAAPLSWNRYLYGQGDPVNRIDPLGTSDLVDEGFIIQVDVKMIEAESTIMEVYVEKFVETIVQPALPIVDEQIMEVSECAKVAESIMKGCNRLPRPFRGPCYVAALVVFVACGITMGLLEHGE